MAHPSGSSFLGLHPVAEDGTTTHLDIELHHEPLGDSVYVSLDGSPPPEGVPEPAAGGVDAEMQILPLLHSSSIDPMDLNQQQQQQQQEHHVLPITHAVVGRRTSSSAASELRVASPELSFGTGWLQHPRPATPLPTTFGPTSSQQHQQLLSRNNSQHQLLSRSSSVARGGLERCGSAAVAAAAGAGGQAGGLTQPLLPASPSTCSLKSARSSSSGSLDRTLHRAASHKQQQGWRAAWTPRVLLVLAMLVCSVTYLGVGHSLNIRHHRQQVHGFYTVTLQPLPEAAPVAQPSGVAAGAADIHGTAAAASGVGQHQHQQQVAVTLTGAVEATPLTATQDLPAAVAATVAAAAAGGGGHQTHYLHRQQQQQRALELSKHTVSAHEATQTDAAVADLQQQQQHQLLTSDAATAAAAAGQGLGGVFDTDDADIQVYTLWGNLGNVTGVTLHLWMRFLCSDKVTLVRGFAVAEQAGEATPFYLDHPKLSDGISNALPQVQLQLGNGSWVPLKQTHQPWKDGSYLNVFHVEGALPPASHPHVVGVEGWEHMADVQQHRGRCDTPHQAASKLPWRRPGSVWTVVSPGAPIPPDLHAYLIIQNLNHHRQLGLAGLVVVVDSWEVAAALLGQSHSIRAAVEGGALHFWVWAGLRYARKVYYPQTHIYNAALLAAWGAGVRLMVSDLDEWLVLPGDVTLGQALAPGGCLAGTAQARIHRYDHVHPDWHAKDRGEASLWRSQPWPQCHQQLYDYRDIGPMPDAIPWKALVNPDQVACFHTHHGLVLDASWPAAHSTLLEPHLGQATGPDREVAGRDCAYFIHFVNLFRVRRHLEEVPQVQHRRTWPHVAWLVNACVDQSKQSKVDWVGAGAAAQQQQVMRHRKLEGAVVEPRQEE